MRFKRHILLLTLLSLVLVTASPVRADSEKSKEYRIKAAFIYNFVKFGMSYTWEWGSATLFYTFFIKSPRLATEVVVNPEPDALNLFSLNVRIGSSRWLDIPKARAVLTFKVESLFDNDIYVSEFQRGGNPNSLPDSPGRTRYAGLMMLF